MTLLAAGALLVGALLIAGLLPLWECPECEGGRIGVVTRVETSTGFDVAGCTTCDDRTKVPLLRKWTYRDP